MSRPSASGLPTVDVVVPCYNYAHFLRRCVASVLSQPGVDVRVLIIDDTSSDDSPAVIADLAATDPRVTGRRHEVNQGHIATYNEGLLGWASADYTVLLSADDLLGPGALARATGVMEANPRVGMVYGRGVYFTDHDHLPATLPVPPGTTLWRGEDWIAGRCRAGYNVISSPEVVFRTSVQQAVGGYRPELPHAGDLEMWLRFAARADVAYVRGRPQAYYRVHAQSMQRTEFASPLADLEQRRDVFAEFFRINGHLLDDADGLHRLARQALAKDALWNACRAHDHNQLAAMPVDALVEFATALVPDVSALPEHRALQRRRRLGASLCHRTQVFAGTALARKARSWLWWQTWKWRGV